MNLEPIIVSFASLTTGWEDLTHIGQQLERLLPSLDAKYIFPHTTKWGDPSTAYVVSHGLFQSLTTSDGGFLATANIADHIYGIHSRHVKEQLAGGHRPLILVDPSVTGTLKEVLTDAILIRVNEVPDDLTKLVGLICRTLSVQA